MASTSNLGVGFVLEAVEGQKFENFRVDASEHVFEGDFVGLNAGTGYARKLVAGDTFLGIAVREVNNSASQTDVTASGDGTVASTRVRVLTQGQIRATVVDGASSLVGTEADVKTKVYASDDRTVTTASTGNSEIGVIARVESFSTLRYAISIKSTAERSF